MRDFSASFSTNSDEDSGVLSQIRKVTKLLSKRRVWNVCYLVVQTPLIVDRSRWGSRRPGTPVLETARACHFLRNGESVLPAFTAWSNLVLSTLGSCSRGVSFFLRGWGLAKTTNTAVRTTAFEPRLSHYVFILLAVLADCPQ